MREKLIKSRDTSKLLLEYVFANLINKNSRKIFSRIKQNDKFFISSKVILKDYEVAEVGRIWTLCN